MTRGFITATLALLTTSAAFGESFVVKDTSGALANSHFGAQSNVRPVFPSLGLYKVEGTQQNIAGAIQALSNSAQADALGLQESRLELFFRSRYDVKRV